MLRKLLLQSSLVARATSSPLLLLRAAAAPCGPQARLLAQQPPTPDDATKDAIKATPDAPPTEEQTAPTNLAEDLKHASFDANASNVGRAAQAEDASDVLTGEARERAKAMTSEAEAERLDYEASGAASLKRAAHKAYNKVADVVTGMMGDPDAGRK